MNKRLILYVHGQGGCAEEASVYEPLFPDCAVKGMVYTATSPWEAREEFPAVFDCMCSDSERITLIANSITYSLGNSGLVSILGGQNLYLYRITYIHTRNVCSKKAVRICHSCILKDCMAKLYQKSRKNRFGIYTFET